MTLSLLGNAGTFILFDAGEAGSTTATDGPLIRGRAGANRAVASHTSWAVVSAASRAVKKPEQATQIELQTWRWSYETSQFHNRKVPGEVQYRTLKYEI